MRTTTKPTTRGRAARGLLALAWALGAGCGPDGASATGTEATPEAVAPAEDAAELLARGRRLLASGDLAAARRTLERALALDPAVPAGHAALADIARAEGRSKDEAELRDAVAFWTRLNGEGPAVQANPRLAAQSFEEGRELLGEASVSLGYQAVHRGRLDRAIAAFERAIDLAPNDDEYQFWSGYAWSLRHDYDRAAARLELAAELNPMRADAPTALGTIRLAEGRGAEARELFEAAVRLEDEDATLQYQYGTCLEQLGELVLACRAYERASFLDPVDVEPYLRLGNLLTRLGREAMGERRLAEFAWWSDERIAFDAWAEGRTDLPPDELARWTSYFEARVEESDEVDRHVLAALTRVLTARGQFAQAQTWMQRSIQKRKRDVLLLADLAGVCEHMGDALQARSFLVRAMKIDPDDLEVRIEHAAHLRENGRRQEALEQFVELAEANPDNAWIRYCVEELEHE